MRKNKCPNCNVYHTIEFVENVSSFYTKEETIVDFKKGDKLSDVILINEHTAKEIGMKPPVKDHSHMQCEYGHYIYNVPKKSFIVMSI